MIRIFGKYSIPSRWDELSPEQYLKVASAGFDFERRAIDFNTFRTLIVYALCDRLPADPKNELLSENIFRLSERLDFVYKIREEKGRHMVALDLCFAKQLLPVLPGTDFQGYKFDFTAGMADTSVTAEQYVDALNLQKLFGETEDRDDVLNALVWTLYSPYPYRSGRAPAALGKVPYETKMAVMYNWIGIIEWISRQPKYDLIFHRASEGQRHSSPIGLENALYSLSEKGYGSHEQICSLPLFTFLDIQLKMTVDSIRQLNAMKMKKADIANELNLTIEQVNSAL